MPMYEFVCPVCDTIFELLRKTPEIAERDAKCPACGCVETVRKVSLAGHKLIGPGWYSDGYTKD